MMTYSNVATAAILVVMCNAAAAFAPSAGLLAPATLGLRASQPQSRRLSRPAAAQGLRMQEGDEPIYEDDSDKKVAASSSPKKAGGISPEMRARLLKENQALGGDPDAPSINFAVVGATIIAGLAVFGTIFGAFGNSRQGDFF